MIDIRTILRQRILIIDGAMGIMIQCGLSEESQRATTLPTKTFSFPINRTVYMPLLNSETSNSKLDWKAGNVKDFTSLPSMEKTEPDISSVCLALKEICRYEDAGFGKRVIPSFRDISSKPVTRSPRKISSM